tara:strand:+ start:3729 stop:4958 length:1230 start_codon:yes stop_codon:yes gene_type:complete
MSTGRLENREAVDIYRYPDTIITHTPRSTITLGDLHGNAAKFLQLLVREGIIEISPADYHDLVTIYEKSGRNYQRKGQDIKRFTDILNKATLNTHQLKLMIIGDDVTDRGKNDLHQGLIYEKLSALNLDYTIQLSNHGTEFLKQLAYGINDELIILYQDEQRPFGESLYGLRDDISHQHVTAERVNDLFENNYLSHVELLSCEVTDDSNILIYSHAPITPSKIKYLAKMFHVDYADDTAEKLADTILQINLNFKPYMTDIKSLKDFFTILESNPNLDSVIDSYINDRYSDLPADIQNTNGHKSYHVTNVHGHVGDESLTASPIDQWTYLNTDTNLGKTEMHNEHHYFAHVSPSVNAPTLAATADQNPGPPKKLKHETPYTKSNLFAPQPQSSPTNTNENKNDETKRRKL